MPSESGIGARHAPGANRAAFDRLVAPHIPGLRSVVRRLVGHPEDTNDVVQEALVRAFEKFDTFRGESAVGTWLCAIGTRKALDYLRQRKRWRLQAQAVAERECRTDPAKQRAHARVTQGADAAFDVREHIAFCFTCVARTLAPEEMAALVLRDAGGYSTREAAEMLETTTSVLRHRLSAARAHMQKSFEGLCALVNKRGACWQCRDLRDCYDEGKRGPELPDLAGDESEAQGRYRRRLAIVRDADVDRGRTQALHDLAWRWLAEAETV